MSREDVVNRLEKVLRDDGPFAKGLSERLARERGTSYTDDSLSERLDRDRRIIVCDDKLADLFDEHVFCQLRRPHAITPTDLKQVLFAQFGGVRGDRFVAAHERFVEHLLLRIPVDGHEGERFDLGYWNKDVDNLDSEFAWKAADGTFDFYVQFYSQAGTPDRDLQAYGTLWGYASTAAMEQAGREFRRLVPSIIRSLSLVYSRFPLSNNVFSRLFHPPARYSKVAGAIGFSPSAFPGTSVQGTTRCTGRWEMLSVCWSKRMIRKTRELDCRCVFLRLKQSFVRKGAVSQSNSQRTSQRYSNRSVPSAKPRKSASKSFTRFAAACYTVVLSTSLLAIPHVFLRLRFWPPPSSGTPSTTALATQAHEKPSWRSFMTRLQGAQ